MESDQHQESSVIKTLDQMNVKLEVRTNVLTMLLELIAAFSKRTAYNESTEISGKDCVRQGRKISRQNQAGLLKQQARKAREDFETFDENNNYCTLIDPSVQTRQEINNYAKEDAIIYGDEELKILQVVYPEDFWFRTEKNFKALIRTNHK